MKNSPGERFDRTGPAPRAGLVLCTLVSLFSPGQSEDSSIARLEQSPPPVRSPEEQLATFRFAEPGYRIELVASDPMIQDPVAITFDGDGRLWVVEMRGYMQDIDRSGVNDPIGRVSVLEDLDADGRMDRSTVFADDLVLPRTVSVHSDGVLIAENRPLKFHRDTDGDLVADESEVVDPDYACDSIEHSANGLLPAIDNWIYNAKEGHRYRRTGGGWKRSETEPRGQWGICQDNEGRLYYNYNHSQLHFDQVPPNSLTRNPNHEPTTGLSVGVTSTNEVHPIRPTRAANRGYIPGALDEEGRIREFTSACSPLVYREALFPEFAGNAFVCSTVGNLIKRNVLEDTGLRVTGTPAYPDRDFLASTDERFRPCWLTTGPEGAIYIVDMYRGVVQDGPHMSPYLREHSIERGLDSPVHLGRIWRVVPEKGTPERPRPLSERSDEECLAALAHPSGWWRDRAQQRLVETGRTDLLPNLRKMATSHPDPLARLHALWTVEGIGDPTPDGLDVLLRDQDPVVQAAAWRVLPSMGLPVAILRKEMESLVEESPHEKVALQLILTLGSPGWEDPVRFALLRKLLLPRINDPLARDAAMSSLGGCEIEFLTALLPTLDETDSSDPGVLFFLESLSQAIVKSRDPDAVAELLSLLAPSGSTAPAFSASLGNGVSVQSILLSSDPIPLPSAPAALESHPRFASWFSWPGHTPPAPKKSDVRPLNQSEQALFVRGRQVYLTSCVACHGNDGRGVKLLAPPLAGSDWVLGNEKRLVRVLFHGLSGPITVSGKRYAAPDVQPVMPPLASLSNGDIAAVLTYIRREWGNDADPIKASTVSRQRIEAQGRTIPWTEEELAPFAAPES